MIDQATDVVKQAESIWMEAYLLSKCKPFNVVTGFIEEGFSELTVPVESRAEITFRRLSAHTACAESYHSRAQDYDRAMILSIAEMIENSPPANLSHHAILVHSLIPLLAHQAATDRATQLATGLHARLKGRSDKVRVLKNLERILRRYNLIV